MATSPTYITTGNQTEKTSSKRNKDRRKETPRLSTEVGGHSPFIEVKNNQVAHIPMTIMFQS